ncbi:MULTISPECIES: hypothetical protein [Clostridia]|uniref:hypothetical protein n=1 Tax=Clostridia TaxID=186801 RepID=UPI002A8BD2FD|nr:hypothetical protein [Peptostreptococcus porci]MDY5098732.1 hypothetical protein [Clostridium sp.]MDY5437508.1 hypothetical protein [Peptostreptococcus porci]
MRKEFYTIMEDECFLNSNFMKDITRNINEAIRFNSLEAARRHFKGLRGDRNFRIVKVNCKLEDVE